MHRTDASDKTIKSDYTNLEINYFYINASPSRLKEANIRQYENARLSSRTRLTRRASTTVPRQRIYKPPNWLIYTGVRLLHARGVPVDVRASSIHGPIPAIVRQVDVLEVDVTARVPPAAPQVHRGSCLRGAPDLLEPHVLNLNRRSFLHICIHTKNRHINCI